MIQKRNIDYHQKGFSMVPPRPIEGQTFQDIDFGKIRVGLQTLDDAILDLGSLRKVNCGGLRIDKQTILKAIYDKDYEYLRRVSNYFFEISGIYERMCKYFAFLYKYDWYVTTYTQDDAKSEKILSEFSKVLNYLDNSNIKMMCGEIALNVIKNGVYYGYIVDTANGMTLQDLPVNYCRSRYKIGNDPAVEFNMKFFDDKFSDINYRMKVLKMFPEEFQKGYVLYKKGKLPGDPQGSGAGWYLLESSCAIKICICGTEYPVLINAIPALLDLDSAQDLDRRKTMQQLLKIIIQKLPLDKNGDLVFDVDEAKDIHNNAVQMLKRAVGVDVMTTFADVDVADMADKNTSTTTDDLERVERTVFNEFGTAHNLFNSDGNIALNASILNDEASMRNLVLQLTSFLNKAIQRKFPPKKQYNFRVQMLETTIYNYIEVAKIYKEHVQNGYSKMLPQIALGLSQSSVIANAHFENEVLKLYEIMIPPLMSSTMSGQDILGQKSSSKSQNNQSDNTGGRPEKPDNQKSEKTIKNQESATAAANSK